MFEPSTSQEAKDMLKEAFEISEKYDTPFYLELQQDFVILKNS